MHANFLIGICFQIRVISTLKYYEPQNATTFTGATTFKRMTFRKVQKSIISLQTRECITILLSVMSFCSMPFHKVSDY